MNFLAHLYLSGDNDHIKIGNFIADAIKGKEIENYPIQIRKGILLHRKIDEYTDAHPLVKISKRRLYPDYGKYSSVIIDIFYDHFLACNWVKYSSVPFKLFVSNSYQLLLNNASVLPEKVNYFLPYMIEKDWLGNYNNFRGIQNTLNGLSRRAKNPNLMNLSPESLRNYYPEFQCEFEEFFPQIIEFVKKEGISFNNS